MKPNKRFIILVQDQEQRPNITVWIAGVSYSVPTSEIRNVLPTDVVIDAPDLGRGVLLSPSTEQWIIDYVMMIGVKKI